MIEKLSEFEERVISVRDTLNARAEWLKHYEKNMGNKPLDQQLLHRLAMMHLDGIASTSHRLDLMHLTMLRILNLLEAIHAPKQDQAFEHPSGASEGEGGGDSL